MIGPFRAANGWLIEKNIRKAEEKALELWKEGYAIICPHTNTRFFQGVCQDNVFLDGDLEILKRCDAAFCIEGHEKSLGSIVEVNFCKRNKIPVFKNLDEMSQYFHG